MVWCLDINGFRDGKNDGPITDEKLTGPNDADVIWSFDMMEEVGSYPHNLANSSPVIFGDLIFVSTSNGQDESHVNVPSPKAPAIIALNKNTGKLVWEDNSVEDRILHGQWSTPSVGKIGGVDQVVSAQGDGWVRGYEALTGKKLWEFDTNPKDSVWPKTRNEVIGTPVIYEDKVYIANGQDPEHGEGVGHLYAIDATKRGDITKTGRSGTTTRSAARSRRPSIADGLLYIPDFSGFLHCLDAKTGQELLDARRLRRGLGLDAGGRRQGLPRRRGRRRRRAAGGQGKKVLAEMNMGSAVYAHAWCRRTARCSSEQPQPAVRARPSMGSDSRATRAHDGRTRSQRSRSHEGPKFSVVLCFVPSWRCRGFWPRVGALRRQAPAATGRIPRQPAADRRRAADAAGDAVAEVDLRGAARRSSRRPAIADGVVYVGAGNGDLLAHRSRDRQAALEVRHREHASASRRRRWAAALVYIGDLAGIVHAVNAKDGTKAVDVQDRQRDQVVAGRSSASVVLIGSYDTHLYALDAAHRQGRAGS